MSPITSGIPSEICTALYTSCSTGREKNLLRFLLLVLEETFLLFTRVCSQGLNRLVVVAYKSGLLHLLVLVAFILQRDLLELFDILLD